MEGMPAIRLPESKRVDYDNTLTESFCSDSTTVIDLREEDRRVRTISAVEQRIVVICLSSRSATKVGVISTTTTPH
eukprot:scaffold4510_cov183-Amphora_coffeaeformis.AAC.74